MNLNELKDYVEQMTEAAEAANLEPADVEVRLAYQPGYPMWEHITSVGFVADDEGTVRAVLAGSGSNEYAPRGCWEADPDNARPEVECDDCGWVVTPDGCANSECINH